MTKKFRYQTVFTYGSLQSVGHTMDYFIRHTRKLVVFIVMPRVNKTPNILRVYHKGQLVEEHDVVSSGNIFLYYLLWFWHHNYFLLKYIHRQESAIVFVGHPLALVGMSIMKRIRGLTYAYWVGDYFPPVRWSLTAYERVKKYYHDHTPVTYYLSDAINAIFNGSVMNTDYKKTVMWGVLPPKSMKELPKGTKFGLLFVGVVRLSQGLEDIFFYLSDHKDVVLRIVGVCDHTLYTAYTQQIASLGIQDRVEFPNTFVDDAQLAVLAKKYHIGVALYEKGWRSSTHYTDPGKVKTYVDLGLPMIMTNMSAIAPYIQKYHAGEVIEEVSDMHRAMEKIQKNYDRYQTGLRSFANYFDYEMYYKRAFVALERG